MEANPVLSFTGPQEGSTNQRIDPVNHLHILFCLFFCCLQSFFTNRKYRLEYFILSEKAVFNNPRDWRVQGNYRVLVDLPPTLH